MHKKHNNEKLAQVKSQFSQPAEPTHLTEVEDLGDGLGDEEDFATVAADDQQETVGGLAEPVEKHISNDTGKLPGVQVGEGGSGEGLCTASAHLKQELPQFVVLHDGRLVGDVR